MGLDFISWKKLFVQFQNSLRFSFLQNPISSDNLPFFTLPLGFPKKKHFQVEAVTLFFLSQFCKFNGVIVIRYLILNAIASGKQIKED
jgi:hypothetical protein